jgi:hypothetical protein
MGPIKSAILAFLLCMGGFLTYHLLASPNGIGDFKGIQDLGQWATPVSGMIAAIVFIIALFAKAASKTE